MINKKFIQKLKNDHEGHISQRRQIISLANVILHDSKRVIFSLHRGDIKKARASLAVIEKTISKLEEKFGVSRVAEEGAYKAGLEEYVEAKMFYLVLTGKKIDSLKGFALGVDSYLGGICDLTGELVRYAVNEAAAGRRKEVQKTKDILNAIMTELIEFNMTGYLRTKYDQARSSLKKIEQMSYEIKIRR